MTQDNPANIKWQQNTFWWISTYQNHRFYIYFKKHIKMVRAQRQLKADQCDFIHNTNSICEKEA